MINRGFVAPTIKHQPNFSELAAVLPAWLKPETGVIKAVVRVP